jgi:hypothetical protein
MCVVYNDVYAWPGWGRISLCWLRLLRTTSQTLVAIATDVPLNPGVSVVNDFESLTSHVVAAYPDASDFTWFTAYLSELDSEEDNYRRAWVDKDGTLASEAVTRDRIETLVDKRIPALPLATELEARLLAAGGERDEPVATRFVPRAIAELPYPHNPSRCSHHWRFEGMVKEVSASSQRELVKVGKRFIESLGPSEFETCPYHERNWKDIANASVRIVQELGDQPPEDDLRNAIMSSGLQNEDQLELLFLFAHPIVAHAEGFTNGQHRSCALRAAGASEVVVSEYVSDGDPVGGIPLATDDV